MNYKLLHSAGDWRKGDVVTEKDISNSNLGGLNRLFALKAIEETDEKPHIQTEAENTPDNTKGDNVDPGTDDTVDKRAERRANAGTSDGKHHGDAALAGAAVEAEGEVVAQTTPRSGRPGTVVKTTGTPPKGQ